MTSRVTSRTAHSASQSKTLDFLLTTIAAVPLSPTTPESTAGMPQNLAADPQLVLLLLDHTVLLLPAATDLASDQLPLVQCTVVAVQDLPPRLVSFLRPTPSAALAPLAVFARRLVIVLEVLRALVRSGSEASDR